MGKETRHRFRMVITLLLLMAGTCVMYAKQAAGITPDKATRVSAPMSLTVQSGSNFVRIAPEHLPAVVTYLPDTVFGPLPMALVMGDTLVAQMVFDTCHMAWRWSIEEAENDKIIEIKAHENASIFVEPHVCPSTSSDTTANVCGTSFEWRGTTYYGSGDYPITLTNVAGCDSIRTLHLTLSQATSSDTTAAVCGTSFEWRGTTYYENGDYPITLTNVAGCDSIRTLHLTLKQPTSSDTTAAVCGTSFEWRGTTYYETGDYPITLTNAAGCDSIRTLHLTLKQPTSSDTTANVCGTSFEWRGATYYGSGDYPITLTNVAGCDSIRTLHLTLSQATSSDTTASVCGTSFEWRGTTYYENGDYPITLTNVAGCDSIRTLHLTLKQPTSSDTTAAVCGTSFEWRGTTYYENGDYPITLTNVAGCDSIRTLHLTIGHHTTGTWTIERCGSYTSPSGTVYTQSGTYTETIPNKSGCDSVVTLILTINTNCKPLEYDTVYFCRGYNTEHEELIDSEHARRFLRYVYQSPATWDYMEGATVSEEQTRTLMDLQRVESNLYSHYVGELTPVQAILWSVREGDGTYRPIVAEAQPQWIAGRLAVQIQFLCGELYNNTMLMDVEMVNDQETTGRKVLRNGQIIIIRNGKEYNLLGTKIQ